MRFFNSLSAVLEFLISYIIYNLLWCDHISSAFIFLSQIKSMNGCEC